MFQILRSCQHCFKDDKYGRWVPENTNSRRQYKEVNLTQNMNYPHNLEKPAFRYLMPAAIFDCFSTYCYKIIVCRFITQKVYIMDLLDFLFAVTRADPYHRGLIDSHIHTKSMTSIRNSERLSLYYKKIFLFTLTTDQVSYILSNTIHHGHSSLIQSTSIRYNHDRRLILHKIMECITEKLKSDTINNLIEYCFGIDEIMCYTKLFYSSQQSKQDLIKIFLAAKYWDVSFPN